MGMVRCETRINVNGSSSQFFLLPAISGCAPLLLVSFLHPRWVTHLSAPLSNFTREEVGPDAAGKFLGYTQWLVNYWLLQQGFSIGIGDTIADAGTMETINATIAKAKEDVKELIKKAQDNQLEPTPGRTLKETFENKVNQVLHAKGGGGRPGRLV